MNLHAHIYIYIYKRVYTYKFIYTYAAAYAHTSACAYICMHTYTYTHIYIYIYMRTYMCTYARIYIHTHMHVYISWVYFSTGDFKIHLSWVSGYVWGYLDTHYYLCVFTHRSVHRVLCSCPVYVRALCLERVFACTYHCTHAHECVHARVHGQICVTLSAMAQAGMNS